MPRTYRLTRQWFAPRNPLPPPMTGWVGGYEVKIHIWPNTDTRPTTEPEAFRVTDGPLKGCWALLRFE